MGPGMTAVRNAPRRFRLAAGAASANRVPVRQTTANSPSLAAFSAMCHVKDPPMAGPADINISYPVAFDVFLPALAYPALAVTQDYHLLG